ncbi:MAG: M6 family metalloprotease domain-containing protein [Bacteroidales bacterium]|jgi:M6 family metalloprotease-like protein|nr:M6 family metalloprotease domain-containing protein [Bacteroidales bacterium]MCI1785865.1 M6 family metalloprotease domain-containing protein [Bacteroidales bacterium]
MKYKCLPILLSAIILAVSAIESSAIPAKRGNIIIKQPNGYEFTAKIRGDEFEKIITDAAGHAIIQNADGYYCYAYYTSAGTKTDSGFKVGETVPERILTESLEIPYAKLSGLEMAKRKEAAELRRSGYALHTSNISGNSDVQNKYCLVILVQFPDLKFTYSRDDFDNMINGDNYTQDDATGSVKKYFEDQFSGKYSFHFNVTDIVTLSKNYSYYGQNDSKGNDIHVAELVEEACRLVSGSVDFSDYDGNNDGKVDNVFVFTAGYDEAEGAGDNYIWSHQWYLSKSGINLSLNGKQIDCYTISSELSGNSGGSIKGIGTFCHEYSHTLGLVDMYDTDYEGSGGEAPALWNTSLMCSGNFNNDGKTPPNYDAIDRDMLGIGNPDTLKTGFYTLEPISENGRYLIMETGNPEEYYLFECRNSSGWDKYVGGKGLLIYHIDKSTDNAGYSDTFSMTMTAATRWDYNEVNCRPDHECAYLLEAYPEALSVSQIFFPYNNRNSFTPETSPAFTFWNGEKSPFSITGIEQSGGDISFTVNSDLSAPPKVNFGAMDVFQDGAILNWTSGNTGYEEPAYITITTNSGTGEEIDVPPYETGKYSYTMENLHPRTAYSISIYFRNVAGKGSEYTASFTTSSYLNNSCPYILFNSKVERNSDGSFPKGAQLPLRLRNAVEAESIKWYLDNKEISTGGDGYYTLSSGGTLKAVITYTNGEKEIIIKEITVK